MLEKKIKPAVKTLKKATPVKKKVAKKPIKPLKPVNTKPAKQAAIPNVRGSELKLFEALSRKTIKEIFNSFDLKVLAMTLTGAESDITEKVTSSIGQGRGRKLNTALRKINEPSYQQIKEARRLSEEQIKSFLAKKKS